MTVLRRLTIVEAIGYLVLRGYNQKEYVSCCFFVDVHRLLMHSESSYV